MQEKRNKDANKVAQDENSLGRAGNKASLLASKEQDAATKALQQKIKVATLEKAVKQKEGSNQGAALKEAKQKVGTDEGLMQHMMMQFGHVKLSVTEDEEAVKEKNRKSAKDQNTVAEEHQKMLDEKES